VSQPEECTFKHLYNCIRTHTIVRELIAPKTRKGLIPQLSYSLYLFILSYTRSLVIDHVHYQGGPLWGVPDFYEDYFSAFRPKIS